MATLLAAACSPDADVVLQPVHRLASLLDGAGPPAPPESCEVGDEFRPAIGCSSPVVLAQTTVPRPQGDEIRMQVAIPPRLRRASLLLQPRVRGTRGDAKRATPTIVPPSGAPKVDLVVPIPPDVVGDTLGVQVLGHALPPAAQSVRTRPVEIGRDAVLAVGLGVQPLGGSAGGARVEFRVVAETSDGRLQALLRATLDPARDTGWVEQRVALGELARQTVRFRFSTSVVGGAAARGADAARVPLWGAPLVLEPRPRGARRNVLLISLDTLRGDYLDGTLAGLPLLPELRRIAERGAAFERAYSTYPSTSAAHMSMFTGLYPGAHGVRFASHVLAREIRTLPEILAAHDYATAAVTENGMLAAPAGFVRGFDSYREFKGKSMWDAAGQIEETFAAGLRWIEQHRDERFFVFLHTYEVHTPYKPPEGYDLFKTWERDGQQVPVDGSTPWVIAERNRYAGEARYTDAMVAQLFARLEALDVLDETIVVVTSDHGDEFGEHGLLGHAKTTYDEVLHVPWIVLAPGLVPRGKRIATPVSLVDLLPTLLGLIQVPAPGGLHGRSLVPLLRDEPFPAQRVLYAEAPGWAGGAPRRVAARAAGFKWIVPDAATSPVEIYDLSADPGEKAALDDPALLEIGRALVAEYPRGAPAQAPEDAAGPQPTAEAQPELDERTIEKLRQLGYVD